MKIKHLTSPWELYDKNFNNLGCSRLFCLKKDLIEDNIIKVYLLFKHLGEDGGFIEKEYNEKNHNFIALLSKTENMKTGQFLEAFNKNLIEKVDQENKELYHQKLIPKLEENNISLATYKSYQLFLFIENIINIMYELKWKSELFTKKSLIYNSKNSNKNTPLSWNQIKECLKPSDKEPPMSIIIKIIDNFGNRLIKLAENPRKVLKRVRKKEHLSKIQQIDSSCLEWLTKQPGITATEKAGTRQKIMAIVRDEDFDTLENRVLKDMLLRSKNECFDFINKYYSRYSDSTRYRNVLIFLRKCNQVLLSSYFQKIGNIRVVPTPNYVLRFDRNYKDVWYWYKELVKKDSDTEKVWKWQHLLWKDFMLLNITSSFYANIKVNNPENLWISREQEQGSWIKTNPWGTDLFFEYKNKEFISSFFIPKSIPDNFNIFNLDIANILGLTGADLFIYLNEVNSMNQYGILIWSLHLLEDIDRAYVQLFKLKNEFSKNYKMKFYFCMFISSPFEQKNDLIEKDDNIFIIKSYSESKDLATYLELLNESILDDIIKMEQRV